LGWLAGLALAQALGIALADLGWLAPAPAFGAGALLLGVAALPGRGPRARALAAVAVSLCAGALHLGVQREAARRGRPDATAVRSVQADVSAVARRAGWTQVELDSVRGLDGGPPPPERVLVSIDPGGSALPGLEEAPPGARVRARLRLRAPGGLQNPGGRSRRRDLDRAGIGAVARLEKPGAQVRVVGGEAAGPGAAIHALRERIRAGLARAGPGGGLIRALAVGDRSGLSPALTEALAGLGLSHLLAVSGLHLALVAGLVFGGVRGALVRIPGIPARRDARRGALAASLLAATAYAALAGWGVPVRRALALLAALALSVASGRSAGRGGPLAAAALGILAFEPEALFLPGPQLSFAASAALLASLGRMEVPPGRNAVATWVHGMVRASATAIAATAPLAAWHMGRVAPFGLIANLVAIPWTACVLLPGSLLAASAAALPGLPGAEELVAAVAWLAGRTASAALTIAAQLPSASPRPAPGPVAWLACGVLCAATLLARRTRLRVAGALAIGALLFLAPGAPIDPPPPRVVFLDVSQGDAVLVEGGPSIGGGAGGRVLVDAGTAIPGGLDLGRVAVVPALRALGVQRLDLVAVSHADLDHRGGVPAVLGALPVAEVWLPFGARADPDFAALRAAAAARGVRVVERGAGAGSVDLGGLRVTPLWPPRELGGASRNDRSLVLRIDVAGRRVLLPGDLEAAGEAALLAGGADLRADLLKLAHHGSRSSSGEAFLAAVDPLVAVASAPYRGRFAMPHPTVLARAGRRGIPVWWTGRDGAVAVALDGPTAVFGFGDPR